MRIRALYVYPVKSFSGISVERAPLTRRGLAGDRHWMVVDDGGNFVTQRDLPAMACVRTAFDGESVVLDAPRAGKLCIPRCLDGGERRPVEIWGDHVDAIPYAPARAWLEQALGFRGDLVFLPADVERPGKRGGVAAFNDAYPLLVIGEASLDDLVQRAGVPLQMERFRPNIVVDGAPAYDEDAWFRVRIGDIAMRGVKRCDRCSIPAVDPLTGEVGKEPTRTLATYRKSGGKVWFGMNLVHDTEGVVAVGDDVVVDERRPPDP